MKNLKKLKNKNITNYYIMSITSYEKCKELVMDKIMKEYETGKLKSAKSRKQAVAIGLSMSENKCLTKFGKKDVDKILIKIENYNSKKRLSVAFVKDCILLYNFYNKNKKYKKANELKDFIIKLALKETLKSNKVNQVMLNSLLELLN